MASDERRGERAGTDIPRFPLSSSPALGYRGEQRDDHTQEPSDDGVLVLCGSSVMAGNGRILAQGCVLRWYGFKTRG